MEAARAICSPSAREAARFERECEALRPLGEAFLLRRFGGQLSRADAEDAVAEVLIRLHRQAQAGSPPQNLRAAFFTAVRNAAIDQLRSRGAKPTASLELVAEAPAPEPAPAERAESGDDSARLQEALQRMRGNYREAIVLRFGLGMTVPEIARHLEISLPAAKKLVLRATRQARQRLEDVEGARFCAEMQEQARRSLFERHASGTAGEDEARLLRAHLEHCGACKSFLASLHHSLHELGTAALLGGAATERLGALERLAQWGGAVSDTVHAAAGKARVAALKASGALPGSDAGAAGALATTGQKIAAICGAATATAATCVAAGVVGPGVAAEAPSAGAQKPAAQQHSVADPAPAPQPSVEAPVDPGQPPSSQPETVVTQDSPPSSQPPPSIAPSAEPAPVQSEPPPSEFGVESAGTSTPASTVPPTSPSPRTNSNAGSGSGVGFGGGGGSSVSSGGGGGVGFQG